MGALKKIEASLPKITYKGSAVGANSIVGAVNTAASQVAKPVEKVAAVTVAAAATAFGIPMTPAMVNDAATAIKVNTYGKPSTPTATPSPLAIAKEIAAVGSVAELYQLVLHRGATPAEIAQWNAKFGATITADEVEQFKIAAQAELAAQTSSTPKTAAKWVIGGITAGLVLLWLANRKKAA